MSNVIQSFIATLQSVLSGREERLPAVSVCRAPGADRASVLVLRLPGPRVPHASWRRLRREVGDAAGPRELVLLDFGGVSAMDSLGIRTTLHCQRAVESAGGRVVACGIGGRLRTLFHVLRLHELIEIFNDVDEALSALGAERVASHGLLAARPAGVRTSSARRLPSESNPGFRPRITLTKDPASGRTGRLPLERIVVRPPGEELEALMVSKEAPARLAKDARRARKGQPVLIGIAGGSCAGKTTLAEALRARLGAENTCVLQLDSYYRGRPASETGPKPNFDEPAALDTGLLLEHVRELAAGRAIDVPVYDFATHQRTGRSHRLEPRSFVIVEGLFALYWPELRELIHLGVFIDTSAELSLQRRVHRDVAQRGRSADSVHEQFLATVHPMHLQHVAPTREAADVVVAGSQPIPVSLGTIVTSLRSSGAGPIEVSA